MGSGNFALAEGSDVWTYPYSLFDYRGKGLGCPAGSIFLVDMVNLFDMGNVAVAVENLAGFLDCGENGIQTD